MQDVYDRFAELDPEGQRAFASGLAHAYSTLFGIFQQEFAKPVDETVSAHDVFAQAQDKWDEMQAMLAVEGVLG